MAEATAIVAEATAIVVETTAIVAVSTALLASATVIVSGASIILAGVTAVSEATAIVTNTMARAPSTRRYTQGVQIHPVKFLNALNAFDHRLFAVCGFSAGGAPPRRATSRSARPGRFVGTGLKCLSHLVSSDLRSFSSVERSIKIR